MRLSSHSPESICWTKNEISHSLRIQQAVSIAERLWNIGSVAEWTTESGNLLITVASPPQLKKERLLGFARHLGFLLESPVNVQTLDGSSAQATLLLKTGLSFRVSHTLDHPERGKLLEDEQYIHEAKSKIWRALITPETLTHSKESKREIESIVSKSLPHNWRAYLEEGPEELTLRIDTTLEQLGTEGWIGFIQQLSERKGTFPVQIVFSQSHTTLTLEAIKLLKNGPHPYRCEVHDASRTILFLGSESSFPSSEELKNYLTRTGYQLIVHPVKTCSSLQQRADERGALTAPLSLKSELSFTSEKLVVQAQTLFQDAVIAPEVRFQDNRLYVEFPMELPRSYLEQVAAELQQLQTELPASFAIFCSPPDKRERPSPQTLPLLIQQLSPSEEWSGETLVEGNSVTILYRSLSDELCKKAEGHYRELIDYLKQLYPELTIRAERDLGLQFHYDAVLKACRSVGFQGKFDIGIASAPEASVPVFMDGSREERARVEECMKTLTAQCSFQFEELPAEQHLRVSLKKLCPESPSSYEELRGLANSVLKTASSVLSFTACRVRGNSLLLTTELPQFPDTVYHRLEEAFADVPAHIEIQHGMQSLDERKGDRDRIYMMLGISTPNDIALSGMRVLHDSITLRVGHPDSPSPALEQWTEQLRYSIAQPIEVLFDPTPHQELLPLLQEHSPTPLTKENLLDLQKSRFPQPPKFRRPNNGNHRGYLDRTLDQHLKILVIDPFRTQVRESGLSARQLDDGRIEIGHHIIDRTTLVPTNSTQERFALDHPFALRGERSTRLPFHRQSLLEQGTLKVHTPAYVISTYCIVDKFGNYESTRVVLEKVKPTRTMAFRQIRPSLQRGDEREMDGTLALLYQVHKALTENRRRDGIFFGQQEDVAHSLVEFFSLFLNERTTKWCQNQNSGIPLIYRAGQTPDAPTRQKIVAGVARLIQRTPPALAPHDEAGYLQFLQEASDITSPGQIERIIATNTRRGLFTAEEEAVRGIQHGLARFSGQWRKMDAFVNQANLVAYILGRPFPFQKERLTAMCNRFNARQSSEEVVRELQLYNQLDSLLAHFDNIGQNVPAVLLSTFTKNGSGPLAKVFVPRLGRTAEIPQEILQRKAGTDAEKSSLRAFSRVHVQPTQDPGNPFRMG